MNSSKIIKALHSRTVGVLIIMVAYNVMAVYGAGLNPQLSTLINVALGMLATYFHVNPPATLPAPTPTPPAIPPATI